MQALHLGCRKKGKFILVINTHVLLTVVRIVGRHTGVSTRHTVRAGTHGGKPTDENEISVKLAALNIRNSARHKEILLSGRKHKKRKLIL
jgi:hypothetical protein